MDDLDPPPGYIAMTTKEAVDAQFRIGSGEQAAERRDLFLYGVSISRDGERIDPRGFFVDVEDDKTEPHETIRGLYETIREPYETDG